MLKSLLKGLFVSLILVSGATAYSAPLVSGKQSLFIKELLPQVRKANSEVQIKRKRLETIHTSWQKSHSLSNKDQQWVAALAVEYKLTDFKIKEKTSWDKLLHRVDVLPESLVLAQAIHESAWGQSRIAKQGNNYFGRFCFSRGCGMMPKKRHDKHEIKTFASLYASVGDYIRNINTHEAYKNLREERSKIHANNKDLHGTVLARHLINYSENGQYYVSKVKQIIRAYKLEKLDTV